MSQLYELARPFPTKYVRPAPQGKYGDYVPHSTVVEAMLYAVGPHDFEVLDFIYDDGELTGCRARMTADIDGRSTTVVEIGDVEHSDRHTNGSAAKEAASDAYKRCAMRLGKGTHLWSGADYFLVRALRERDEGEVTDE